MKILISIYIWVIGMIYVVIFLVFALMCTYILPERIYDPWLKKMMRFLFVLMFSKVEVEGLENIKPGTTYLFMANHVSLLDPPLLAGFIPGIVRGAEAASHHSWPLYGLVMKRFGNVPIERESIRQSVAGFRKLRQLLENGRSMIILPEGHRTLDGQIRPFKKLPFALAKEVNNSIIPVGLSGLYRLKRKESWIIRPSRIKISFGPEITRDQISGLSVTELRDYVQIEIARLVTSN